MRSYGCNSSTAAVLAQALPPGLSTKARVWNAKMLCRVVKIADDDDDDDDYDDDDDDDDRDDDMIVVNMKIMMIDY